MSANPTYRTFIGVAKDSTNTFLAAATAVGATTITTTDTVAASSTIFFVDGQFSESRAVTGGGGTTTLTVSATTYAHSANCYIYVQLTASIGPTDYIPVTSVDWQDVIAQLPDKGYRGSNVESYGSSDGIAHAELTIGGDVFADTIGYMLGGVTGATDFTGGTPNQHDFSAKNTGDGQATPHVLYVSTAVNTRAIAHSRWESVSLNLDPAGLLTYQAKAIGKPSGIVANPTASFSSIAVEPVWQVIATVNGSASNRVISASIDFKRKAVSPIHTQRGVQDAYRLFQGPLTVTGKATFLMEDETELALYLANTQGVMDFTFAQGSGASATQVKVHMTKVNLDLAKPTFGKDWLEVDATFEGLANTTDATTAGTGYSPAKVTLKNTKSTGTYI